MGYVAGNGLGRNDVAFGIPDWGDGKGNLEDLAMLSLAGSLKMIDPLSLPQTFKNLLHFAPALGRQ